MNIDIKVQRCNFLPEGEMAIIKDTNTLIHNIVNSELKEKDKEIDRLNNIINELEKTLAFDNEQVKAYNVEHPEAGGKIPNFPSVYLDKLKELKKRDVYKRHLESQE